jgi:RNA polymerase sigma-70 factor (ECF subfamily)
LGKHLDIKQIITGCQKGQPKYQRALVNNYSELLYSVCRRYTGDDTKAQDVLQETFIRIFKSFKTYDPDKGALSTWMRRIAINCALRSLKKKKLEISNLSVLDYDQKYSIEPEAISKMSHDDLLKVVQTLPDGYRQVFNLAVIEGYNHKEIGEMLGIAAVSSRSNLSRAKQLLRKKILEAKTQDQWINIV